MTLSINKRCICLIIPAFIVVSAGLEAQAGDEGIVKRIREAVVPVQDSASESLNILLPEDAILAQGEYQGGIFWTDSRKDKISRFKCSGCHNDEKVAVAGAAEMAHGDIALTHGSIEKSLNCYTCHNKENRDFLRSEKSLKIDMDHSYKMCGQCHFRQEKDWKGGAHGKRVGYWAGDRMIMNCTSCHDPHSPRFKKRWPKTYSPPDAK